MKDSPFWATMLKNAIAVVCFTILACVFDHWWIVLIAWFFQHDVKITR